jgi:hypothetical protein
VAHSRYDISESRTRFVPGFEPAVFLSISQKFYPVACSVQLRGRCEDVASPWTSKENLTGAQLTVAQ